MDDDLRQQLIPLLTVFVFVLGACIGSFLNVVIWRLPRRESLSSPGSHCPKCQNPIRFWENIPLVSWLCLRGRCHFCRQPISMRYPLVELVTALLFTAVWWTIATHGLPWSGAPRYLFLTAALACVFLIDIEHGIVPDAITGLGLAVAFASAIAFPASLVYPGSGTADNPFASGSVSGSLFLWLGDAATGLNPRLLAAVETASGAAFGAIFFLAVRYFAKAAWGRQTLAFAAPVSLRVAAGQVDIPGYLTGALSSFLGNRGDRVELRLENWRLCRTDGPSPVAGGERDTAAFLTPDLLIVGTERIPWSRVAEFTATIRGGKRHREVLGLGDVKLIAMLGAFLGSDSCLYITLLSTLGALGFAGIAWLSRVKRLTAVPYAPFLAGAALIWFFAGNRLVSWYGHLIVSLYWGQPA